MSNKYKLIGLAGIIILAILLLVALTLPLTSIFTSNEIAIIQINGEISYDNNNTNMSIESIESGINDANNNPSVKAIVIEINSQGGSLVASEEIAKLIKSSKKPTVSWISDSGTSEAYLIASGADTIVATHSSAVGGIGLNLADNTEYNKNSNLDKSASMIKQDYEYLIKEIAKNRGLKFNQISEISKGEVYNGNEAYKAKLIDKVGDKEEAIKIAASKAKITNYTIVKYPKDSTTQVTSFLNQKMTSNEEVNLNSRFDEVKEGLNVILKKINEIKNQINLN